ncbi:hypothetical protein GYB22_04070 [bacterium]|nr:hypothetical protein [bacterium]
MNIQFAEHKNDFEVSTDALLFENQPFNGVLKRDSDEVNGEAICHYQNGKKNGVFKEWYLNGEIKEVSLFKDGELHGRRICYWPNGTKRYHVNYINGDMDGIYEEWDDNGMNKQTKIYYKGKLIRIQKVNSSSIATPM